MQKNINAILFALFQHYVTMDETKYFDFATKLINTFRKESKKHINEVDISSLITLLNTNKDYKTYFKSVFDSLTKNKDFDQILSDSGIINYSDFLYEVKKRIGEKILPYQPAPDTLEFTLNQLFYANKDAAWLQRIPKDQLITLTQLLELKSIYDNQCNEHAFLEITYALEVLIQRVSGRAMEADVAKMVPDSRNFDSPFIGLQKEVTYFFNYLKENKLRFVDKDDINYKQLFVLLKQCNKYIDNAYTNSSKIGISIKVNQTLFKIRQQLERISTILPFTALDKDENEIEKNIDLGLLLITINSNKTNVSTLIRESTQAVAYEITQHKAQTGEHYITSSRKEYLQMLWSAGIGGAVVAVMCIIKLLLSDVNTSEFGHAVYYSANYAVGFILIYLIGGTLATKQPSMTASALASSMEKRAKEEDQTHKYWAFATFFSQLFRSQFIAFMGNILLVFPVAFGLIWVIDRFLDLNIASNKWRHLLEDLNPTTSSIILYACIAGVFLFLSGIIAGNVSNNDKFNSVYYRIEQHPLLKKMIGINNTKRFANWYKEKWAGIMSNFWFGVFMGSAGIIGLFLGIDIDVRHITFAGGNIALGIFGSNYHASADLIVWTVIGMIIIGFFNFIVSFSLSFALALKARRIRFSEVKFMFKAVWALFKVSPRQFFLPPSKVIKKEELL